MHTFCNFLYNVAVQLLEMHVYSLFICCDLQKKDNSILIVILLSLVWTTYCYSSYASVACCSWKIYFCPFQVMKVYNMSEDDFPSLEEWNAYLEEIEEIVYNITNDINKAEMEKKIENYEKLNKNEIRKNYSRK